MDQASNSKSGRKLCQTELGKPMDVSDLGELPREPLQEIETERKALRQRYKDIFQATSEAAGQLSKKRMRVSTVAAEGTPIGSRGAKADGLVSPFIAKTLQTQSYSPFFNPSNKTYEYQFGQLATPLLTANKRQTEITREIRLDWEDKENRHSSNTSKADTPEFTKKE